MGIYVGYTPHAKRARLWATKTVLYVLHAGQHKTSWKCVGALVRIFSIDPGLATGIADVTFTENMASMHKSQELPFSDMLQLAYTVADMNYDYVVMETFIYTSQTVKKSVQPWSTEIIGVFRAVFMDRGTPLLFQKPKDKDIIDNNTLRSLGLWYKGGGGHANDALRHAVVCAIKHGWRPE